MTAIENRLVITMLPVKQVYLYKLKMCPMRTCIQAPCHTMLLTTTMPRDYLPDRDVAINIPAATYQEA